MKISNKIYAITLIFSAAFANPIFAQNLSSDEQQLLQEYSQVGKSDDADKNYDLAEKFAVNLSDLIKTNANTIDYAFPKLSKNGLVMATSPDKKFRIYSWDTYTGGTMKVYRNIYQWSNSNQVSATLSTQEEGDPRSYCTKIYNVNINGDTYYLAISTSVGSTLGRTEEIQAYKIEHNHLIDNVKLFKTKSQMLNKINFEYDADDNKRSSLISYNNQLKEVYIPVIENNKVSSKNLVYQLKGSYFQYIGVQPAK